ncbi:hypothetical protein AGMMS49990_00380 [Endomicrobiia bacterium]|nr:hypothetical protein AGMMS49990_00380 [Endomicrobiia bacterium]
MLVIKRSAENTVDGTFRNITFNGIRVIWDASCTVDTMYFVNADFLYFKVHKNTNFKWDKRISADCFSGVI